MLIFSGKYEIKTGFHNSLRTSASLFHLLGLIKLHFIQGFFLNCFADIASNGFMIVDAEFIRMWKEVIMTFQDTITAIVCGG
jgi:hypothetical protein